MPIGISPWPKHPPPPHTHTSLQFRGGNGDYTVCLWCGGKRNEHTGEINSDVQNHQQELMRRLHLRRHSFGSSARPGQANAACYCGEVERLTYILSITSEPYESCYVWNRAHQGAPVTAGSGPFVSQHNWKTQRLCRFCAARHVFVCVVCRRSSELHSLQTQSKAWLKSNFCLHNSCYL